MIFSLLILGAPYSTQAPSTALRFAKASLAAGHTIHRIFFYHDGVNCANELIVPAQDDIQLPSEWQTLAQENTIDMVVCIASAIKRGVINQTEAERYDKQSSNLLDQFDISGLGQLIDTTICSDRVITFGP
jgi:tRNA 2-thiouridine synthesizing protein D